MSRPKKPSPDPHSDRIAAEVSRRLNHALAGIDLRSLINVSKSKKPARQAAPPRKRSLPVEPFAANPDRIQGRKPEMKSTLTPESLRELLSASESAEMAGVAKRSWWRYVSSGRAPQPVRLGGAVRWRRSELAEWIAAGCPRSRKEAGR